MRRKKEGSLSAPLALEQIQLREESIQTKTDLADALYYAIFGGGGGAFAGAIFGTVVTYFAGLRPDMTCGITIPLRVGVGLLLAHKFDPARQVDS